MRIAILSDIHSNWDALSEAAREINLRGADRIFHLGDLVGYGAEPEACVRWAMEHTEGGVCGNNDEVAGGRACGSNFNKSALKAALWSRERLSKQSREYLAGLSSRFEIVGCALLVHGAPKNLNRYVYSAEQATDEMESPFCENGIPVFFGHTHVAGGFVFREHGAVEPVPPLKFRIGKRERALLNPGSVGQPRDRNPDASFLIYDTDLREAEWVRTPYDIESAHRKILSAGLPDIFANRLRDGI